MSKVKVSTNQIIWGIFNLGQQVGMEKLKEKQEHRDEVHTLNVALESGNLKIINFKQEILVLKEQIATLERVQNFNQAKKEDSKTPEELGRCARLGCGSTLISTSGEGVLHCNQCGYSWKIMGGEFK